MGADRWDENSLEQKFRRLTAHVLEPAKVDRLVKMVLTIEDVPDIRQLVDLMK